MIGIYQVKNKLNGKIYIGQSVNIKNRWNAHRNKPFNKNSNQYNSYFYRAIREDGLENFEFSILEECSKDLLDEKEKEWISKTKSNDNNFGYNMTDGGDTTVNQFSKLDISDVENIRKDLSNRNISQTDISKKYNVSQVAISDINIGRFWYDPNIKYPIREKKWCHYYCDVCGKEIDRGSKLCKSCSELALRKKNDIILDEKYQNLEKTIELCNGNLSEVARRYSVSATSIRKRCTAKNIDYKQIRSNRKK